MLFPVTMAFAGPWRVHLTITDAGGARFGYSPLQFGPDNCLRIFDDDSMATTLYAIEADRMKPGTFHLRDATGAALGRLTETDGWRGRYQIAVGAEPAFDVTVVSPALHFVDSLFEPVPGLNLLTGMMMKPCRAVERRNGTRVATIVKQRTALDTSYVVEQTGAFDARERECILLSSAVIALNARSLETTRV